MNAATPIVADSYREFLEAKVKLAPSRGFDVALEDVNPALKPHARAIVPWACSGGRRAIFASFGLGKTSMQLEIGRQCLTRFGGHGLIVVPLGVRHEFFIEQAARHPLVRLKFVRRPEEMEPENVKGADRVIIHLTNYETVRDGKLDPSLFTFASLDEAACLRAFGGSKTFREFMRLFDGVRFRFCATAVPDPNEYIELLAYAAFLGVMDVGEAKTRFFKRDSEKADRLTIHPHKEEEFWLWVASWALFIQRPSDLGFSDDGYELPDIDVRWHEVVSDHATAGEERDGQGRMFRNAAFGVSEASAEKRATINSRVEKLREILNGALGPGSSPSIPSELLSGASRGDDRRPEGAGCEATGGSEDVSARVLSEEQGGIEGRPAGESKESSLRTRGERLRRPPRASGDGLRDLRSEPTSEEDGGGSRPQDGEGARHPLPPMQSGNRSSRRLPSDIGGRGRVLGQALVWCDLNEEQRAIERALGDADVSFSSLYGSQPLDLREELLTDWKAKKTSVFLSKPSMYGAGINMQQAHCMVFAGIGFRFHDVIQAVHRCYRFLQTERVEVHFIYTEAEREIRRTLELKWRHYQEQAEKMAAIIRRYGLASQAIANVLQRSIGAMRHEASGDGWRAINNDCVDELRSLPADSIGLVVTSIPFSTQYEYTPSFNDFGHTDDDEHFWRQMDFLTPELLRVLQPGRIAAVHVKDRIVPGGINGLGFQTVSPFSDQCTAHFRRHGFAFLARKTIVTDVVRENNQTYRLGWTEQCKDGSRMGAGMPEYLLIFRKPPTDRSNGYADVPVVKAKPLCDDHGEAAVFDARTNWKQPVPGTGYSRARWQLDAHGFTRSSGDRLLSTDELRRLPHEQLYKLWRDRSTGEVYDFAAHLAVTEDLDHEQRLPATFMLLPPHSSHPDVWTDVARMRTLNGLQHAKGREMHLCPLQFDIVDRAIVQYSMPGETVLDPFGGLMTVPYCAIKLGRQAVGIELNTSYWRDGVTFCREAEAGRAVPTLFDLLSTEAEAA